jgi:hypothetical protein
MVKTVTIETVKRNEGTIVVFGGQMHDPGGMIGVEIAVDHRPAREIITALRNGYFPMVEDVETWQIIRYTD